MKSSTFVLRSTRVQRGEPADAAEAVDQWLKRQGYTLEMRVAQEMRRAGFEVEQSAYYQDQQQPDTWREIDILAWREAPRNGSESPIRTVRLVLAIECKSSAGAPWVLFTVDAQAAGRFVRPSWTAPASDLGFRLMSYRDPSLRHADAEIFRLPARIAYGIARAHLKSNEDVPYQACWAAIKAAIEQLPREDPDHGEIEDMAVVALPIVIVEGPIFEAFLGRDKELQTAPISAGCFIAKRPLGGRSRTLVHIVASANTATIAASAAQLFDKLLLWADEYDGVLGYVQRTRRKRK
jgi:hypothetical protein